MYVRIFLTGHSPAGPWHPNHAAAPDCDPFPCRSMDTADRVLAGFVLSPARTVVLEDTAATLDGSKRFDAGSVDAVQADSGGIDTDSLPGVCAISLGVIRL